MSVTAVARVTLGVSRVTVVEVAPPGTATLAGTAINSGRLLVSGITAPAAGAAALSVIVSVAAAPPGTLGRSSASVSRGVVVTDSIAVRTMPPRAAVRVAVVGLSAVALVTGNVVVALPAAMVTLPGKVTVPGRSLES